MDFIQIVDSRTQRPDDLMTLGAEWLEMEPGPNAPKTTYVCRDREDPSHFVIVAVFDSYETAMANSAARETDLMAQRMQELSDGAPTFTNLDLVHGS